MKQARFELRLTEEELKGWRAKAAEAGMLLASWIRERCNETLEMVSVEAEKPVKAVIPPSPGFWTPPAHDKTCQCQVCKFKREVGK